METSNPATGTRRSSPRLARLLAITALVGGAAFASAGALQWEVAAGWGFGDAVNRAARLGFRAEALIANAPEPVVVLQRPCCGRRPAIAEYRVFGRSAAPRVGEASEPQSHPRVAFTEEPTAEAERLVLELTEREPQYLAELEAIVGPLDRNTDDRDEAMFGLRRESHGPLVEAVDVTFLIDIYHEDPTQVTSPMLGSYWLTFTTGAPGALSTFRAQGAAVDATGHLRLGLFTLVRGTGDRFTLAWDHESPMPERSASDTDRLVTATVALLKRGPSPAVIEQGFGALALDPDWGCDTAAGATWTLRACPSGAAVFERVVLTLRPPLPGAAIVGALRIADPVVVATDVHMTSRKLVDLESRSHPAIPGYRVSISVVDDGLEMTDLSWPGSAVWRARGTIQIHSLRLSHM